MLSRQGIPIKNERFEEVHTAKLVGTKGRRAERKYSPVAKEKKKQDRIESVCPSSLWPTTAPTINNNTNGRIKEESCVARKPNKITSTKPDVDLLFSLFSVIENEEKDFDDNDESFEEGSLSPQTSPNVVASHSNIPIIPYLSSSSQESTSVPLQLQQPNYLNPYSTQQQQQQQYSQGNYFSHYSSSVPIYMTDSHNNDNNNNNISSSTSANIPHSSSFSMNLNSHSSYSCEPSSFSNEDDYSVSLEHGNVNSYDVMTLLPPIFDNKLIEKAVPFSELVDVFNM